MKRLVIVLALLCPLGILTLQAQKNSFFIGGNAGVNTSKFKFTQDLSELYPISNGTFGLNGGLNMGLEIHNFTLMTGIEYVQKGGEYQTTNFEDEQGVGFYTARENWHMLSIPILLGYRKYFGDKIGVTLALGPSINIGISGKMDEEISYFGEEQADKTNYQVNFGSDINDDYRATQPGFRISPGLIFLLNDKSKLTFNVTWDSGTKDAYNPRYKDANDFFDQNRGLQLTRSTLFTVGYEHHFTFNDKY